MQKVTVLINTVNTFLTDYELPFNNDLARGAFHLLLTVLKHTLVPRHVSRIMILTTS